MNLAISSNLRRITVVLSIAFLAAAPVNAGVRESTATFRSAKKSITVERFEPEADGKYPAILVLHGSCGLTAHAKEMRALSTSFAEKGYATFLVHYFDRTGTKETTDVEEIKKHFLSWLLTIHDAVDYVAEQDRVDRSRIGVIGFSLGAYLSLAAGCTKGDITAVIEVNGGLPVPLAGAVEKMPPVLIIHGEADKTVSVQEARALEKLLKTHERSYELVLFKDQGHVLTGDAAEAATRRSLAFFGKHLSSMTAEKASGRE
jgi:carboxymethylenebutenolidase